MMLFKRAKTQATNAMTGRLSLSSSGWLLLSVPNALVRGTFDAMDEPGIELPPSGDDGALNAHISVMRPEEIAEIGGPDKVTERGHTFSYSVGRMRTVVPAGWAEMSRCWMLHVHSPALEKLRKSYGLSPRPNDNKYDFHITVAVRRKKVLQDGDVRKAAEALTLYEALRAVC